MAVTFILDARLRVTPTELGGRSSPVMDEYRPQWDLSNTWLGEPTLNDGTILIDSRDGIAPGGEGVVRIQPLWPEFWGHVRVGMTVPMQEGQRILGHATITGITLEAPLTSMVLVFIAQARQFCSFVQQSSSMAAVERLSATRHRLLGLYQAALALPHVTPNTVAAAKGTVPAPANWVGFGEHDLYWEVFDPYLNETPVAGSLSDDLLDIFLDVTRGLSLWDTIPTQISDAIWEWRFSFDSHWGEHAVDALRALHRACTSG